MGDHVDVDCANCGVEFCLPAGLHARLRRNHETFYCPNGHRNFYPGKTKEEKHIEELERRVRILQDNVNGAHQLRHDALDEFATCFVSGCSAKIRKYHFASRRGLFHHLERRHGLSIIIDEDQKALTA